MNRLLSIILSVSIILLTSVTITRAQSFMKTDPSVVKVMKDTTYMTALEVVFEPGKKTNWHTHPATFNYVLEGGKILVEYEDGTSETVELKTGDYVHLAPERPHRTVNVGTKPMKMLLIEFKEHAYAKQGKMKNNN